MILFTRMIKRISNAQMKQKFKDFAKIQLNRFPIIDRRVGYNRAVLNAVNTLSNKPLKSRLKKSLLMAAKKIRLIRSKRKTFQVPLDIIRKARSSVIPSRSRGKKRVKRLNWVYRWVHKENKKILLRIKLRNAALMRKRCISLSKRRKEGKRKRTTIYIRSTYNNTLFTLLGAGGRTICCISTGMCGFKNTRKSTSYASQVAAQRISTFVKKERPVYIKMCGLGPGKLSGVKALAKAGVRVGNIRECSSLPHNGCRPTKRRRL